MPLFLGSSPESNQLLEENPFALLVGMILDQQVPMERAFSAPSALVERLGGVLDPESVLALGPEELRAVFAAKPALHRFPSSMADRVRAVAEVIVERFGGETASIWRDATDGADLWRRVRSLPGFGEQKSRIFIALLGKRLGLSVPGWADVAGPYGRPGTRMSIADVDSQAALEEVREHKREVKAAVKGLARLEHGSSKPPAANKAPGPRRTSR